MDKLEECDVCINECTILISCPQCLYKVCKICTSKYLCESINEPNCMNCKHPFNREILIEKMGNSWYESKYKNTRKQVLFESEKAKFPETMDYAQKYKNIDKYENQIRELNKEYDKKYKEFQEYKINLERKIHQLQRFINNINNGNNNIPVEAIDTGGLSDKKTKTTTKLYTKCPIENCQGMLNDENKCITCDTSVCRNCFEVCGDEHVCDQNTIETLKLLKKDTKNCPGCSTPIHKIEGCYQMWCTNCHITFHYRTLEILNEKIHNPHYVDWLKNNTTIQQGGDCQNLGYNLFSPMKKSHPTLYVSCCNIYAHVNHIEAVNLSHARRQLESYSNENSKRIIRAQFMVGKIDEKKYKMLLFKSYKQTQRWGDIVDLITMYIGALKNTLQNIVITKDLTTLQKEMSTLIPYVVKEKERIDKLYGNYSQFKINFKISNTDGKISLLTY